MLFFITLPPGFISPPSYLMSITSAAHPSRHAFWDPHLQYPTSDLRTLDRPSTRSASPPPRHRTQPTGVTAASPNYSSFLPKRKQIEPGVWSDGSNRILSAACPTVQNFLKSVRRNMCLPPAPSEAVFALAALDVFYQIDDPAHWIFWNDERKHQTAAAVSRISRTF